MNVFRALTINGLIASCTATTLLAENANVISQRGTPPAIPSAYSGSGGSFDVVSIRQTSPGSTGFTIRPDADDFSVSGSSIAFLIQLAYNLHQSQVENVPLELRSLRFDVAAKMDNDSAQSYPRIAKTREARQELLRARLQSMLAERFHLQVHKTTKQISVFNLAVADSGPKLKPAVEDKGYTATWGTLSCTNTTMDELAAILANDLQMIVRNMTGMSGRYAFTLQWNTQDPSDADYPFSSLATALKKQLGLKLISMKGPVEVVVVDHAELPAPN